MSKKLNQKKRGQIDFKSEGQMFFLCFFPLCVVNSQNQHDNKKKTLEVKYMPKTEINILYCETLCAKILFKLEVKNVTPVTE